MNLESSSWTICNSSGITIGPWTSWSVQESIFRSFIIPLPSELSTRTIKKKPLKSLTTYKSPQKFWIERESSSTIPKTLNLSTSTQQTTSTQTWTFSWGPKTKVTIAQKNWLNGTLSPTVSSASSKNSKISRGLYIEGSQISASTRHSESNRTQKKSSILSLMDFLRPHSIQMLLRILPKEKVGKGLYSSLLFSQAN